MRPPFLRSVFALAVIGLWISLACSGGGSSSVDHIGTVTPPAITSQPQSLTVTEYSPAAFTVTATGTAPLTYKWMKNGTVVGTNSASYTIDPTVKGDNGASISVTVSNYASSVTSDSVTLTLDPYTGVPKILTQPQNQTVQPGSTATFSVTAGGPDSDTLTYQWYEDGFPITIGTSASYTTPATTDADSGAIFYVTVTDSVGSTDSSHVTLTVSSNAPAIVTQPTDQAVTAGSTVTFSVVATGTAPLTYQWYRADSSTSSFSAISGATSTSFYFTTASTDNGAQFYVIVTNSVSSVQSNTVTLTVN